MNILVDNLAKWQYNYDTERAKTTTNSGHVGSISYAGGGRGGCAKGFGSVSTH